MPGHFSSFKRVILKKRKKSCAKAGSIIYSLAELVKKSPRIEINNQFFFLFLGVVFFKTWSRPGSESGSGIFLIQIVASFHIAGSLLSTAFIFIFSSLKSEGTTSSFPWNSHAEEVNCISLDVSGCHWPLDSLPSTLM